jgi:hypothetical protein
MRLAGRVLVVIVLSAPLLAAAQPARTPPSELARGLAERAKRHFDAKEYDKAAAALRAALRFEPKPQFMYALAQAQRLGGDCAGAIQSYQQFLGTSPPARQAEAARENITRCEAELTARPASQPEAVAPGASQPAEASPRRAPWYRDVLGDSLAGGGLALAIAGAAVWGVGRGEAKKANSASTYDAWVSHSDGAMALQRAGVAVLSVGGALIVAGVVRYVLRPARRLERPVVTAAPAPGGGALLFAGRF